MQSVAKHNMKYHKIIHALIIVIIIMIVIVIIVMYKNANIM